MMSCCPYTLDLETDGNKKFVAAIRKQFNVVPGFYAAGLYVNCDVVECGPRGAGGKADDKDKLMAALKAVKLKDTPRGPITSTISATWSAISTSAAARSGRMRLTGSSSGTRRVKTYENVSQFWTWPEKEFLAHPVYSRDYPPLTKC